MRRITYKKAAAVAMAAALSAALLVGCGSTAASTDSAAASTVAGESTAESTAEDAEKTADEGDADEVAAKNCADLIDAIYVQERSADTDAQCEAAKAAWDALTDTQKELVEGENADPDYFGRDTGDASKDDARNEDNIGENELLVRVSGLAAYQPSLGVVDVGDPQALQARTAEQPLVFLSGPEGGLSPAEEALARAHGFAPVTLGSRVLRAETAPLAALGYLAIL